MGSNSTQRTPSGRSATRSASSRTARSERQLSRSSSQASVRVVRSGNTASRSARSGYSGTGRAEGGSARANSSRARAASTRTPAGRANNQLRSVSVAEVRDASRYRNRKQPRRWPFIVLVALLAVLLVGGIAWLVLSQTNTFAVEEVTVSGAEHITTEEISELAAVPVSSTLLNIDSDGIATRLATNPWVEKVTVQRKFPHTINLAITERSITAVVSVTVDNAETTQQWVLAADGMWIMEVPDEDSEEGQQLASAIYEDLETALEITDIPYGSEPEAGTYCNNANVENALAVIDGMTTELADQVQSVSAASSDSTTLTLENGVEIAFGDSEDIRDKEQVCLALLEEHEGEISYINVRNVNSPVWRSL